jgi:putative antitoxin of VapBC-like toxin-antitoxin system
MRTTLDVEDRLLRDAKRRAVEDGRTLTAVIEAALRQYLAPTPRARIPFRLHLLTKKGRLQPGVDLADRDSLYDRMEGRG